MEQLKNMKQCLTAQIQAQMANLQNVDTQELGEAIDMVKDLSEAIYYCTIAEAMEGKGKENEERYYNVPYYYDNYYYRDMDKMRDGRMYYSSGTSSSGNSSNSGNSSSMRGYNMTNPFDMRDSREGSSHMQRRSYMESKEMGKDKDTKLRKLNNYVQNLTEDIMEMIETSSEEEKQVVHKGMVDLANKIKQTK